MRELATVCCAELAAAAIANVVTAQVIPEEGFTIWDTIVVDCGDITGDEFVKFFKEQHGGVKLSSINAKGFDDPLWSEDEPTAGKARRRFGGGRGAFSFTFVDARGAGPCGFGVVAILSHGVWRPSFLPRCARPIQFLQLGEIFLRMLATGKKASSRSKAARVRAGKELAAIKKAMGSDLTFITECGTGEDKYTFQLKMTGLAPTSRLESHPITRPILMLHHANVSRHATVCHRMFQSVFQSG